MKKIKIIGAGITGLTIANLCKKYCKDLQVEVIESRSKIGGNCSSTKYSNGIEVHDYGPHIFHTSYKSIWKWLNQFADFVPYEHHVLAQHDNKRYFMPFNLSLINQFFNENLNGQQAKNFIDGEKQLPYHLDEPKNLEEKAISLIGPRLYEAFIKGYTTKQWGTEPTKLDPNIIKRIPIRYDYNISYYDDDYVGIPRAGYQAMFEKMASGLDVHLNQKYANSDFIKDVQDKDTIIVYTGPIDELFDYSYGNLEWRSLRFERLVFDFADFQGCPVVNYVDSDVPYTRVNEYKHYHHEDKDLMKLNQTVVEYEYPQEWVPSREKYYPVSNEFTKEKHDFYCKMASLHPNLILAGRLAEYKYYDMDDAVYNVFMNIALPLVQKHGDINQMFNEFTDLVK